MDGVISAPRRVDAGGAGAHEAVNSAAGGVVATVEASF